MKVPDLHPIDSAVFNAKDFGDLMRRSISAYNYELEITEKVYADNPVRLAEDTQLWEGAIAEAEIARKHWLNAKRQARQAYVESMRQSFAELPEFEQIEVYLLETGEWWAEVAF